MNPTRIENAVTVLGAPPGWDPDTSGPCLGLPIRIETHGGIRYFVSAWEPTPAELLAIKRGAAIRLMVSAPIHPVVALGVGPIPGVPEPIPDLRYIDTDHPLAQQVEVWDEATGLPLDRWVRAVNVDEGWADCYSRDVAGQVRTVDGRPEGEPVIDRVTGQFSIRWKQEQV